MAVDWFNGLEVEPVRYLPKHIITQEDVDNLCRRSGKIINNKQFTGNLGDIFSAQCSTPEYDSICIGHTMPLIYSDAPR